MHDCNLRTSFHIDFMHAPVQIGYCTILPSFPLISLSLPTTALRRNFTSDAVEHGAYQWLNVNGLNLHNVVHRIVFKLCAFRTQRCVPCCGIAALMQRFNSPGACARRLQLAARGTCVGRLTVPSDKIYIR